ncbi:MAG: HK97 family phage prohead protease [Actinomycetota bacterium]|nr:HK97 family phage prohead protease [Actinomycetota bacterium]
MSDKLLALAEVKAIDTDNPNGSFEAVLSAPTVDRDGEVIDPKAFEPLPPTIPIHAYHDFSDPVARAEPVYESDVLTVRGYYASTPRAQEIRTLVAEGVIGHMSVGFMPPEREVKAGTPHIIKAEILEGSFVSVPANREAAILTAKGYEAKVGARNNAEGSARLQQIHDLSVANGADCTTKAVKNAENKTVAGSFEERAEQLRDAIRAAHPDSWWVSIVATFDDAVVYELDTPDGTQQFRSTYEISDAGVTLGSAETVDVTGVVVSDEGSDESTEADPEKAAAPAAASSAEVAVDMARLAAMRAEAELLLT